MARISIIVPVYNVEKYLSRCVDSILAQTFSDFELLLIDDGSPDRCPEICDYYQTLDTRIHVIHKINGGVSSARNVGLDWTKSNSKSEFICFIDSDDWIHTQYLEILLNAMENNHTDVSICCHIAVTEMIDITTNSKPVFDFEVENNLQVLKRIFDPNEPMYTVGPWAKLFRTQLFQDLRFPEGKMYEDLYCIPKAIFNACMVTFAGYQGYFYYQNLDSTTHSRYSIRHLDEVEGSRMLSEYFYDRGEYEVYHSVLAYHLNRLSVHCRCCANIAPEKSVKLKQEFFEIFSKEKKRLPFRKYHDLWEFSCPIMKLLWLAYKVIDEIKENGLSGLIKKMRRKLIRKG